MGFYKNDKQKNKNAQSVEKPVAENAEKISEVIDSYENFSEQPVPDDAKGFSAHHSACKSAVIHAETLLKLAEWTDEKTQGDKSADGDRQILELLNEARNELNGDDEN